MANRYPLILDTADSNKIKELQTGDNLNLADNSIVGVQNITALGTIDAAVITVEGNRLVAQTFTQLTDTPNNYTGHADKFVAVNAAGTAIEFRPLSAFGNIDVSSLDTAGNILPTVNNTLDIGSTTAKFANVYAADFVGNLKTFDDSLIFNASTGKVPYAAIEGAPTNVSEFTNDVGFATSAGINQYITDYFAGAGGGALKVDITGSVFADDSTVLIDGIAGKIVGDIHYPTTGSITAGTKVQLGTTELTSTIEPPTANTGAIGTTTKRFGTGYFQNINASGNITAATFNGTLNGILIGDQIGSVFGDDSSVLVDAVSGVHYGQLVGDVTGSVFADDSGVIIDGINAKVVGMIDTTSLRTSESAIALGKNAGKTSHGTRAIAIGEDAGETSQGGNAISIGTDAGKTSQGSASIAIGASAGLTGQSVNSIAIGASAGTTNLAQNSIIINATGGAVENTVNASLVVKPIRAASNANFLKYNVLTGEITYEADAAGVFTGDLTGSVFADDSTLLIDGVNARHNFPNNVLADLSNVSANVPTTGQVLKWDGAQWAPALDATSGGGGLDADTLNGQNGAYYLNWGNFASTPTTLAGYGITDGGGDVTASSTDTFTNKSGNISQWTNDENYLTSVPAQTFASLTGKPTTVAGYGITDAATQYANSDVDTHLNRSSATSGQILSWNGSDYAWVADTDTDTGILNVVEDTTPQLGGNLDAQAFDITTTGKILYANVYALEGDLPNASTYHGMFAHVHGTGKGYFAHGGNWTALQNESTLTTSIDTHLNQSNPTSGYVLAWNGSDYAWVAQSGGGGASIGNFTFASSVMDTDDSSTIIVTPAMRIDSDLTVQNDLVVNNTVTANKLVSTAVGVPKFTSATNIELNAGGAVIIGSSALRIKSFTTTERNALTAATGDVIYNSTLLKMQLRIGSAWKTITIADDVPTNNNQLTNGAGYITDASSANSHTFTLTSNGASDYVFAADSKFFTANTNDPVLYLRRGDTYTFTNNAAGHPFEIRASNGGSAYSTGVTNNGGTGNIVFTVPMGAPATLYYQCTLHAGMGNTINIV